MCDPMGCCQWQSYEAHPYSVSDVFRALDDAAERHAAESIEMLDALLADVLRHVPSGSDSAAVLDLFDEYKEAFKNRTKSPAE